MYCLSGNEVGVEGTEGETETRKETEEDGRSLVLLKAKTKRKM